MKEIPVDVVFLGSCTNSRIEDLRAAADIVRGRTIAENVRMMVVPGSQKVRAQAEAEVWTRFSKTSVPTGASPAAPCAWA